jgi:DNA-3-methyladenine glycosylase
VTVDARPLPRRFYDRDPLEVAPELLGRILANGSRAGRIVEVEAYRGAEDAASHAYRGRTPRCATMFGPPGHLYVYFTYGMHFCSNIVCWPEGRAGAVLVRALAALHGVDAGVSSCRGPAKLCRALGIDRGHDGADLVGGDLGVLLLDDGAPAPASVLTTARVGLSARVGEAAELPWRFYIAGDPHVSGRLSGQGGHAAEPATRRPPPATGGTDGHVRSAGH